MDGEWGPTDKGSSIADDPLHLHIAHLDSGSWTCITDGGDRQFRETTIVESDKKHN